MMLVVHTVRTGLTGDTVAKLVKHLREYGTLTKEQAEELLAKHSITIDHRDVPQMKVITTYELINE